MSKLYINARFLSQPLSGVQRFAVGVARELKRANKEVVFLCPQNSLHKDLADELNAVVIGTRTGHLWEQLDLPAFLKANKSPKLIGLANTGPVFYSNQCVVLHDIAFHQHPEWFSKKFVLAYRLLVPRLIRKCKIVYTVSEFSAREIRKAWPQSTGKVVVVGNGLDETFHNINESPKKVVESPYILAMTGNNLRKKPALILAAFQQDLLKGLKLIVTGRPSSNFGNTEEWKKLLKSTDGVIYVESPDDEALKALYSHAEALVYLSYYEGFGLPPLEAMSCGCPVILSDIPVFRENFDHSALFLPVDNEAEIANAVHRIRTDHVLRDNLIAAGRKLAEKHTFKVVANNMLDTI